MSKRSSGCRSCLIWMACIFAGFLVILGIAVYLGYQQLVALRDKYTQPKPLVLPAVRYTPAEVKAIESRVDQFLAAARSGNTNAFLRLSEDDMNSLLWSSGYSNMVYVTLTNDSLRGQVSLPIESLTGFFNKVGVTFLKGRYLNGEVTFKVAAPEGKLLVQVSDMAVNGRPLPAHYMKQIRQANLAEGVATNASTHLSLQRVRRIAVENNSLVLDLSADH